MHLYNCSVFPLGISHNGEEGEGEKEGGEEKEEENKCCNQVHSHLGVKDFKVSGKTGD